MGRRAASTTMVLLLLGALLAAPAQAKTGELDHLRIAGPGLEEPVEISGAMLNGQLAAYERADLYRPLLTGRSREADRPAGDLGPAYDFIYVFLDVYDDPVQVHETVYLEADPPVAFATEGQTHELYPGDVQPVPWGWRPFPEAAATALPLLIDEAARSASLAGDVGGVWKVAWWEHPLTPIFGAILLILLIVGIWFFLHRRRPRTS